MRENLSGVGKILGSTRAVLESGRQRTLNGTLNSGESPVFEPPPDILFFQPISGSDPLKLSISLSFIFLLFHSVSMYLTSYQSSYASRHPTLSASLSLLILFKFIYPAYFSHRLLFSCPAPAQPKSAVLHTHTCLPYIHLVCILRTIFYIPSFGRGLPQMPRFARCDRTTHASLYT